MKTDDESENTSPGNRPAFDSVERTLTQVGDRWTFLILREAFFGVRRFDGFLENTRASPSVLTNRLKKLVENDILVKAPYGSHPSRFDYGLTPKGLDLYSVIVLMMQWGDKWIPASTPPLQLTHSCSRPGPFELVCPTCSDPIDAHNTSWIASEE